MPPIELSIVIPARNEALTIGRFLEWCFEGLERANVVGEVLIINTSEDNTAEIARSHGATVIEVTTKGLGLAYRQALPHVRGRYVLMGDCDCTYDFREIAPFVDKLREGNEFVMGTRLKGYLEPGAMPALHQHFGTPLTTWILNKMYGAKFTDIHCGMRALSTDAFRAMDLRSDSWEYASEMVLKSIHLGLKIAEVPVRFYRDQPGRLSHHRRTGWWSPWQAGWINLRAMFIYGADFFLLRPGIALLATGVALTLGLLGGPVTLGPITFSLYWMLLGVTLALLGLQCVYMGILAQIFYDLGNRQREKWLERFEYTRTVLLSAFLVLLGAGMTSFLLRAYWRDNWKLVGPHPQLEHYWAVGGLFFLLAGFMTFTFTLLLHASVSSLPEGRPWQRTV